MIPAVIAAAMLAASYVTVALGGPSPVGLFPDYVGKAFSVEVVAVLCFVFIRVAALARTRADRPLAIVWSELRPRLPLLALPVVIFPIFLAAFTAVKSAIPRLVGFHFDRVLANADALLLGQDAWRFTHAVIGPAATEVLQYLYVWGWIAVVGYTRAMVPLFASRRFVAVFYATSLMTWFFAGFVGAYLLSSAGPIFADLADPSLVPRFAPMKAHLAAMLPAGSPFLNGPLYLEEGIRTGQAYSGGGISAMPSMHIATATLLIMASRRTRFFVPACLFAGVIFVGSIHSGYHYVVDAIVAAAITIVCWRIAERIFPASADSSEAWTYPTLAPLAARLHWSRMTVQSRIPPQTGQAGASSAPWPKRLRMSDGRWLLALLLALLVLSAIAPIGYMGGGWDDWRYLNAARCWREFGPCLPHDHWQSRWPLVAPLAAITWAFGESRLTVSLWPFVTSFLALWFLALAGNRLLGRPVGWIAAFLLLLTPAFSLIMLAPRIESVELAAILGGAAAMLEWQEKRDGRWALLAGLMFGIAVQARETAAIATGFAAVYVLTRKPRPSAVHMALAALGLAIPFAVEFLVFWASTGDPLWRRKLDVGHTEILSSELLVKPDPNSLPFFNPTYIANWRREVGIHVQWSVDGVLNLLANPRAGITLTIVPLALLWSRRMVDAASRRKALSLWAGAMVYVAVLTYALAMDPKSRIMLVPICAAHLAFALLSWRLIQAGRPAPVYAMWGVLLLIGIAFPVGAPRISLIEPTARGWIAAHPGDIEIDPNSRRQLTLINEARELPGLNSDKGFLLYDTNTTCVQLLKGDGPASAALKLVAERSMSVLGFIPAPWGEACLFKYERPISGDALRQAIATSRHDGPYILAPRPEAVLERD